MPEGYKASETDEKIQARRRDRGNDDAGCKRYQRWIANRLRDYRDAHANPDRRNKQKAIQQRSARYRRHD
jgi:hypothetical protein